MGAYIFKNMKTIIKNLETEGQEILGILKGLQSIEFFNKPCARACILEELENIGGAIGAYENALLENPLLDYPDEALTLMAGNFYALCQYRDSLASISKLQLFINN